MPLDDFIEQDRHKQFLDAITDQPVSYGQSTANTYLVGNNRRVWYHHAAKLFAGVRKNTREDLLSEDERQLVHLFIIKQKDAFEEFIEIHEDNIVEKSTHIDWYALPDNHLRQYSTAGSPDKFSVNKGDFNEMGAFYHDSRDILG